jgi:hypothetical protein
MKITKKQKKKFQINLDVDIKYHSSEEENYINDNIIKIKTNENNSDIEETLSEEENTSKQKQKQKQSNSSLKLHEKAFNSNINNIWLIINGTDTYTRYSVYSSNILNIDIETLKFIGTCKYDPKDLRKMNSKTHKFSKNFEIEKAFILLLYVYP